jgi:dTDP-4-dehydrorhamnose reductase
MIKKIVLITGGSGLLAINWACAVRDDYDVVLGVHQHGVDIDGTRSYKLELESSDLLEKQLQQLSPDLVIHTAGMTSVDQCEKEPELAERINALLARYLAIATAKYNIPLVHISTDHLFTGNERFYKEDSELDPVNEYGRSKAIAENWVQTHNESALIIRTNFFCWGHAHRQSFSDWLIYSLREGKQLSLFDDVYFSPILADTLALAVHELVEKKASGVYNLVGDERVSKYSFAMSLCKEFDLPTNLLRREQLENAQLQAKRPQDMSLDNQKLQKALGRKIGTVAQFLAMLHEQEIMGRRTELLNAVS